jgi:hypothetical protein
MTEPTPRADKYGFEIKTCGRCGGSGHYSYCQRYGTRCFGCGGTGVTHTKRGAAAMTFFMDSLKVPLGSLAVGDKMRSEVMGMDSSVAYLAPITEIKPYRLRGASLIDGVMVPYDHDALEVTTEHPKYGRSGLVAQRDHLVRRSWDRQVWQAKLADALAYQASLTQAGTVAKRRKAK